MSSSLSSSLPKLPRSTINWTNVLLLCRQSTLGIAGLLQLSLTPTTLLILSASSGLTLISLQLLLALGDLGPNYEHLLVFSSRGGRQMIKVILFLARLGPLVLNTRLLGLWTADWLGHGGMVHFCSLAWLVLAFIVGPRMPANHLAVLLGTVLGVALMPRSLPMGSPFETTLSLLFSLSSHQAMEQTCDLTSQELYWSVAIATTLYALLGLTAELSLRFEVMGQIILSLCMLNSLCLQMVGRSERRKQHLSDECLEEADDRPKLAAQLLLLWLLSSSFSSSFLGNLDFLAVWLGVPTILLMPALLHWRLLGFNSRVFLCLLAALLLLTLNFIIK